jgi:hypothetical protein
MIRKDKEFMKEAKHSKPISTKDLNADIKDEIDAAKAYHKQGLHGIEEDEIEHRKVLEHIKKDQETANVEKRIHGIRYYRYGKPMEIRARVQALGKQLKRDGIIDHYRVVELPHYKNGYYCELYVYRIR